MPSPLGSAPSGRAYRRVVGRIQHRGLWSADELAQLDRLYHRAPKLWWHTSRVVRQQVRLGTHAHALGLGHLLTAPLLEELAFDSDPDALVSALIVAFDVFRQAAAERPWTSLQAVLCALLRQEEEPLRSAVEMAPIDPGPAFTPLLRREDLKAEALEMESCIGEHSWWRQTVDGLGCGFAVRHASGRATVWVASEEPGLPHEVVDALGQGNRALEPVFRDWITAAVAEAGQRSVAQAASGAAPGPVVRSPAHWKRLDAMEKLGDRLCAAELACAPPAMRADPSEIPPLPGLPPVHWVHQYRVFREPPIWRPSEALPRNAPGARSHLCWDDTANALVAETREGTWTLHAGLPLQLDGPEGGADRAPFLWMDARVDEHDPQVSAATRKAQVRFLQSLPEWLRETCAAVDALRGMPGIWLLSRVPQLAPVLTEHPFLVTPVLNRAWTGGDALQALPRALQSPELCTQVEALLGWLGVHRGERIRERVHRLQDECWSLRSLQALERILTRESELERLLARLHPIRPAHAILIDAAVRAGLQLKLTTSLLCEVEATAVSPRLCDAVAVVFAELELAAASGGARLPRLRSLSHVARLLVERRQPVATGSASLELPGPWGAPARSMDEVAGLASNLGCDPDLWRTAAGCGWLVFAGVVHDLPTVSWIQPAGLRGGLRLACAHVEGGQSAPRPVLDVLERAIEGHNDKVARLPAGWSDVDAQRLGLPAGLATLRGSGQFGTGELIFHLLDLRG